MQEWSYSTCSSLGGARGGRLMDIGAGGLGPLLHGSLWGAGAGAGLSWSLIRPQWTWGIAANECLLPLPGLPSHTKVCAAPHVPSQCAPAKSMAAY